MKSGLFYKYFLAYERFYYNYFLYQKYDIDITLFNSIIDIKYNPIYLNFL